MNHDGGGKERVRVIQGPEGLCNLPEILAAAIKYGTPVCARPSSYDLPLFDRSVFPLEALPPVAREAQPPFGRLGPKVDDIKTIDDVRGVVDRMAASRQSENPLLDPVPARFDAVAELMENVIAKRRARRNLIRYLLSVSGATPQPGTTDPTGRAAWVIEIPDSSRAGHIVINFNGDRREYDLTDAAEVTMQLYYDPETFTLLARRDVLDSTALPELQPYVDSQPVGTASINTRVVRKITTVHQPKLVAYRVPCSKFKWAGPRDNFCAERGAPGGSGVALHINHAQRSKERRGTVFPGPE